LILATMLARGAMTDPDAAPRQPLTIRVDPALRDLPIFARQHVAHEILGRRLADYLDVAASAPPPSAEAVLDSLPLADRLAFIDRIEGKRGPVKAQLERARDDSYRAARAAYPGPITNAARRLESDLANYARGAWKRESGTAQLPQDASSIDHVLHGILRLSNGKPPIGWRQILNLWQS
jgi:hypothetical protein